MPENSPEIPLDSTNYLKPPRCPFHGVELVLGHFETTPYKAIKHYECPIWTESSDGEEHQCQHTFPIDITKERAKEFNV